ncbi:MAG: hypothetical protein R3B06_16300 [Kofleriaceae bacterium]
MLPAPSSSLDRRHLAVLSLRWSDLMFVRVLSFPLLVGALLASASACVEPDGPDVEEEVSTEAATAIDFCDTRGCLPDAALLKGGCGWSTINNRWEFNYGNIGNDWLPANAIHRVQYYNPLTGSEQVFFSKSLYAGQAAKGFVPGTPSRSVVAHVTLDYTNYSRELNENNNIFDVACPSQ